MTRPALREEWSGEAEILPRPLSSLRTRDYRPARTEPRRDFVIGPSLNGSRRRRAPASINSLCLAPVRPQSTHRHYEIAIAATIELFEV